jgi:organic radical activating enzyme
MSNCKEEITPYEKDDKETRIKKIDCVSKSFCIAKWKQVTIDLHNGQNHSCHHPLRQDIPLDEIKDNPGALHNTKFKKNRRKEMLEGVRPSECGYCWNIEDNTDNTDSNLSDRYLKSISTWSYPHLKEVVDAKWDENVNPSYLEVMFDNKCNLSCAYCMSNVSSSVKSEMDRYGRYPVDVAEYHRSTTIPKKYEGNVNPYIEAFWKWMPTLLGDLKVLRITGGEPFLSPHTMTLVDYILENPCPEMDFSVNTNLCFGDDLLQKYLVKLKKMTVEKHIRKVELFTSVDSYGKQAEYIRFGLRFDNLIKNIRRVHDVVPEAKKIIMITFNIMSIPNLHKLIAQVVELRDEGIDLQFDLSYLNDPEYLRANILGPDLFLEFKENMNWVKKEFIETGKLLEVEIDKLKRTLSWIENTYRDDEQHARYRRNFILFVDEYDRRKKTNFLETFPEFSDFYAKYK